jgi:glucodextranase-like protein/FecR-like protein
MFKRKKKSGQPVGSDIDWFIIPIRTVRSWGILVILAAGAALLAYQLHLRTRFSPEQRAAKEIASAADLLQKATAGPGASRPASLAQAQDLLQRARDSYGKKDYDPAFRQAVESQSYSRRVLGRPGSEETGDASLISVEGDVSIQTAGRSAFGPARQRQVLFDGDFIKTGRSGSAELMFSDGTLYMVRPGSLFEVRRPASADGGSSQIKMVSGAVNVYTASAASTVDTDAVTAAIDRESRVAVDVEKEKTDVTTFRGKATVSTGKETVLLGDREKVSATARTRQLSAKVTIPEAPFLVAPVDSQFYDLKASSEVDLKWGGVVRAARYRLQIARSRLFVPDAMEVDLDNRTAASARVRVSREGSYFWRVAAIDSAGRPSDWSAVRRFKMLSEPAAGEMGRSAPPQLTVATPQQMGNVFLVFGKTDPGAVVTINAEPADVDPDGSFKKTVTLNREGSATLIVKAVDASGNETVRQVKVFVESL